jgi:hypothetical protein
MCNIHQINKIDMNVDTIMDKIFLVPFHITWAPPYFSCFCCNHNNKHTTIHYSIFIIQCSMFNVYGDN